MRALVCKEYGHYSSLVIEDIDDPVPGPGEVLVDIVAAGINFPDILVVAGQYQDKTPPPFVPGNEAAGTVAAVGEGVDRLAVGDRVIAYRIGGAFAEKFCVPQHNVMPLPESLDFEQGAGFMVTYGTSYHALKQSADLQPGETVLVLGAAGGVGITAVQIAKAMGARVIAAASSEEKLAFARESGADVLINYSDSPLRESLKELDESPDVVVDPVGGELAMQALRSLAWQGRYLVIGFTSGEIPSFPANLALLKEAKITGVWWGTWCAKNPAGAVQNVMELGGLVAAGKLNPQSTSAFPLAQFVDAFATIAERRVLGKVVMTMQ